ncbi:thiamine phosphate synthase [Thalassospira australica]|uniref:thiamine phosphate synthase n=1 Tax=Thalassospira australica TaxID=1528106 RepID=UPI00384E06C2
MDATLAKQARQLNLRNGGPNCQIPPIVLMTDDKRLPDPVPAIIGLPPKSMVIFRHYGLARADRAKLAYRVRRICRQYGHLFLIANDLALAQHLDADGIHLPEYRIHKTPQIYRQVRDGMLITSACHKLQTLRRLALLPSGDSPDAALISPVFQTRSHPGQPGMDFTAFLQQAAFCQSLGIVPIALGGIKPDNVTMLRGSGVASLAGIGFSAT